MGNDKRDWGFTSKCLDCGKRFVSFGEDPFVATIELLIKIARHEVAVLNWKRRSIQKEINRNAGRKLGHTLSGRGAVAC